MVSFHVHSWPICRKKLEDISKHKIYLFGSCRCHHLSLEVHCRKSIVILNMCQKYHYPPIYKYVILEEEACAVAADVGIVCQVLTSIFFPSVSRMWRMPCGDAGDLVGINRQRKSKNKPFWSLWGVLVESVLKKFYINFKMWKLHVSWKSCFPEIDSKAITKVMEIQFLI